MGFDAAAARGATIVGPGTGVRVFVWAGFPLVGAGAGWLLRSIADWAARLPWVPMKGPFTLLASVAERPVVMIGALVVGAIAGLVIAGLAERDFVTVAVDGDGLTVTHGAASRAVPRASVNAVFLDGKQLVLLGHRGEELLRQGGDLPSVAPLAEAIRRAGYPWLADGDPYDADYRRWVEGLPGLPAGADGLFRARARALERRDAADAAQLRTELGAMGIVVRDDGERQHWRLVDSAPEPPGR